MRAASYNEDGDEARVKAAIETYAASMGEARGRRFDDVDELIEATEARPLGRGDRGGAKKRGHPDSGDDEGRREGASPSAFKYSDDDDEEDDDDEVADPFPIPPLAEAPFSPRLSLPAPAPMSPGALYVRLVRELQFPESGALMSFLDRSNADLFSNMPDNVHLYENSGLLSQNVDDVIAAMEESERTRPRAYTTAVDLNAHGTVPLPRVPDVPEELKSYVEQVESYFLSELEAREAAYAKLFLGYCAALARYIYRSEAHDTRGMRPARRAAETKARARQAIVETYYREAARLAKVLYLHLYMSVCREAARRLSASQAKKRDLFVRLKFEWPGERQFSCLFHPVMQNHGTSTVAGEPLTAKAARNMNHMRVGLGMLPVRFGLLETPGRRISEAADFKPTLPRSSWFLGQKILAKLGAYSKKKASERAETKPNISGSSSPTATYNGNNTDPYCVPCAVRAAA